MTAAILGRLLPWMQEGISLQCFVVVVVFVAMVAFVLRRVAYCCEGQHHHQEAIGPIKK
jgi:hypothetical protein